jgi:CBS domain containing-hemolysin-like protein
MTVVTFLFGEVMPKAFAASHPKRVAYLVALPLYHLHQLLRPAAPPLRPRHRPASSSGWRAGPIPRRRSARPRAHAPGARRPETPAHETSDPPIGIIAAAARATDMTVADIMVPRTEVVAFSVDTPPATC